jgi:putative membrane protein
MVLWLAILPFAFMPAMGPWTVLLCGIVGYQLLGFEDIGVEIESPFGTDYNDLPVDSMQAAIFNNLIKCLAKVNEEAQPAPAVNN